MPLIKFMASPAGRVLRVIIGAALVFWGITTGTTVGYIVAVVGLVPLLAGIFDKCVFAPLFGMSLDGKQIRK